MARSIWKKTLLASLAWAGFAWIQAPAMQFARAGSETTPAAVAERIITVQEAGMPSHKCKVIKTWQTPEGANAYQVQALDSGEIMTIVESGPVKSVAGSRPGTRVHAVATRIFHWRGASAAPADAPAPPVEKIATVSATTMMAEPVYTSVAPRQIAEQRQGLLPRLLSKSHGAVPAPSADSCCAPQAGQSSQAQPSRSESQVYQPYQSQPSRIEPEVYHQTQPSRSDSRVYQPYQTQPSRMVTSSSPYAPITSASPYAPIAISCAPCEPEVKPAVSEQKVIVLPALKLDHDTTCTTCTTCPTLEKPVSTTAATAKDDWRQSWDKADEPKAPAVKPEPRTVPFSLEIPHADAKKPDPLQMPETFLPVMEKTSLRKAEAPKKLAGSKEMYDWSGGQGADKGSRLPPGTQSVVEAGVIAKGPVQYVPVPIVTMPDMSRPPRAPQPFGEQNGAMANAYGSPSKALGPNMTTNDESMVNAFTSLPSREMVAQASNAFTDGASTAGPQPVMPAAAQPMYPRSPYGMMAQAAPAMPSTAMTPQGVMPVGYQAPMSSDPRMVQSAAEQQMLAALHGSLFPSQREWAAEGLATLDWRIHPEIVQALVTAAREDPAPTVRVACLHDLTKMQVSTMLVVEAVQKCMGDQDPRVRQEAEQALAILHPATPHDSRSSLQPVGSWRPN